MLTQVITTPAIAYENITEWLTTKIAKELALSFDDIDETASFMDMGLSSLATIEIVGELENWLNIEIDPSEFWDYPNIELLAHFLMEKIEA